MAMKLKVQELTHDAFAPYGTFFKVNEGYDNGVISFIADRMPHYIGASGLDSLCSICMRYRPLELTVTEYHEGCEEVFGMFDGDVVFHAGLLGEDNQPAMDSIKVFFMPAGTIVRVKRRVLHHAGFVTGKDDVVSGLVLLPPFTYTVDCKVIEFDSPIPFEL
jgi:hypothetical protein